MDEKKARELLQEDGESFVSELDNSLDFTGPSVSWFRKDTTICLDGWFTAD